MKSSYGATDEELGLVSNSFLRDGKSPTDTSPMTKKLDLLNGRDHLETIVTAPSSNEIAPRFKSEGGFVSYLIYAAVNSIMCVPGLYGYTAVIFNNEAFGPHINALSKLVLWSSTIHQFSFTIFSSLPFAIGQVQDAGLIFLSAMSNIIANNILQNGGTTEEVVSTTLVILSLSTAALGALLVLMGRFKLADVVSYLPFSVVGGYLAFIGYFCLEAGVALCISKSMMGIAGWAQLWDQQALILAAPGVACGLALTLVSRNIENNVALPLAMVVVPCAFYCILWVLGLELADARKYGWIGEVTEPVPVTDLFNLVDLSKVHWNLVAPCFSTWIGMVFVVSFSSCLDVAAISMDLGEALDVNKELTTVGISNFASGMTLGFTGSYIFSQTIFTCRTGTNSRWVGILCAFSFIGIILSTINVLEVAPLFFLGSTLIFVGADLMYEWLIEIRHKLLLTEYCVLLATFFTIQVVGIDAGIILGVCISIVDYVFTTARFSSVTRVMKRSRAVWERDKRQLLNKHGYHIQHPKIVTLEIKGTVFFGSSLQLLSQITEEISINVSQEDIDEISLNSPWHARPNPTASPFSSLKNLKEERMFSNSQRSLFKIPPTKTIPRFVVLDLAQVPNMDSAAARGCFLQLARMCSRHRVVVCASGATPRVDWILRAHLCVFAAYEEEEAKLKLEHQLADSASGNGPNKIFLFETLYEALEYCESKLILELFPSSPDSRSISPSRLVAPRTIRQETISLSTAFVNLLGLNQVDTTMLEAFERKEAPFHDETEYHSGEAIFQQGSLSDAFFVVLSGSVAVFRGERISTVTNILSGAGNVQSVRARREGSELGEVSAFLPPGSVFGFVDFILIRQWEFSAVAAKDNTLVARLHRGGLERLQAESPELNHIMDKVLLQAAILELVNVVEP